MTFSVHSPFLFSVMYPLQLFSDDLYELHAQMNQSKKKDDLRNSRCQWELGVFVFLLDECFQFLLHLNGGTYHSTPLSVFKKITDPELCAEHM